MGLTKEQKRDLSTEVVSDEARLRLTRLLRESCQRDDDGWFREGLAWIGRANKIVNLAHQVMRKPLYELYGDGDGEYHVSEGHWHASRLELIMREATTVELAEILCDYVENALLDADEVDRILADDNVSFSIEADSYFRVKIKVAPIQEIEEDPEDVHPNIRLLVDRMERNLKDNDYAAVLHTAASIHETMAKIVMPERKYQGKSFADIVKDYRSRSVLPDELVDYINEIYIERGREPLAGHGSAKPTTVTPEQAVVLCELTKTLVRVERRLAIRQTLVGEAELNATQEDAIGQPTSASPGAS